MKLFVGFIGKQIIITRLSCTANWLHSTVLPSSNEADCRWSALERSKVVATCLHFCTNTIHLRILKKYSMKADFNNCGICVQTFDMVHSIISQLSFDSFCCDVVNAIILKSAWVIVGNKLVILGKNRWKLILLQKNVISDGEIEMKINYLRNSQNPAMFEIVTVTRLIWFIKNGRD